MGLAAVVAARLAGCIRTMEVEEEEAEGRLVWMATRCLEVEDCVEEVEQGVGVMRRRRIASLLS